MFETIFIIYFFTEHRKCENFLYLYKRIDFTIPSSNLDSNSNLL